MKCITECVRLPQIEKDLKTLGKKFPTASKDLVYAENLIERSPALKADRLSGFAEHQLFKMRTYNTDIGKGKSDGYRLVYEIVNIDDSKKKAILVFLYEKKNTNDGDEINIEINWRLRSSEYSNLKRSLP